MADILVPSRKVARAKVDWQPPSELQASPGLGSGLLAVQTWRPRSGSGTGLCPVLSGLTPPPRGSALRHAGLCRGSCTHRRSGECGTRTRRRCTCLPSPESCPQEVASGAAGWVSAGSHLLTRWPSARCPSFSHQGARDVFTSCPLSQSTPSGHAAAVPFRLPVPLGSVSAVPARTGFRF